ncbi:methyl-accepting chemotaxis domain-containing protein [Haloarcula amylovorans]|uniref:hypothetical protein n=1 Tax=Haloarcula amylovorans TaxID=2562280 RepID=UPI001075DF39|nr:hypothetical protein [Halomicroarcula amylolytica]
MTAATIASTDEETTDTGRDGQETANEAFDELDAIRGQIDTAMLALNTNIEAARAGGDRTAVDGERLPSSSTG